MVASRAHAGTRGHRAGRAQNAKYTGDLSSIPVFSTCWWEGLGVCTFPTLVRFSSPWGADRYLLGHPLLDRYLEFVAGRARPNTLRAVAFDLKTFFSVWGSPGFVVVWLCRFRGLLV